MPFNLQSSGDKSFVKSQVSGQITASYDIAPKGKDREDNKKALEKIRDYLFDDLGADYPENSPTGLVLVGDAGEKYIAINRLEFSLSKPAKPADEENNPPPQRGVSSQPGDKPAPPDKGGVEPVSGTEKNPTTASPNFSNKDLPNPTTPGGSF